MRMKPGAMDRYRSALKMLKAMFRGIGNGDPRPRWMRRSGKYQPHQGPKEIARRRRQIERGQLRVTR